MSKKVITLTMPTQAEMDTKARRAMGVHGTVNGSTKVQSNKGKKAYNRRKENNSRNWE